MLDDYVSRLVMLARQELKHAAHAGRRLATKRKPPQGGYPTRGSPLQGTFAA